jgi:hypothetical protein
VPTSNTLVPLPSANSTWREDEVFDAKTQIHTYSSKRCRITIRGIDEEDKIHTSIIFVHYNDNLSVGCDNLNFTNIVKQLKK